MNISLLKNFLLPVIVAGLFNTNTYSQTPIKNYEAAWKKVEDFTSKGLPKSAVEEVKKIYALAKKEKQEAQVIKSLVYITELQSENRENNQLFSIADVEKEITVSNEPVISILKSLLAEMYWNYYQNNRWKLYNRTLTEKFEKTDIETWTTGDFHKKISELYLQSIGNEKLLQQTKLEKFDAIITKGNIRHLRPTMYDLLAHRAISYFENDERDIKKPAYAFEINQLAAFDPAGDFITRKFTTKDSLSLQHKALLIYQKLIAFHLYDAKSDALIDADIHRIEFVKAKSTHPEKDKLYFNAINRIANQNRNNPAASQAWYLLASYYEEKANTYKPYGDTTFRYARIKAKEILEKILQQKDSSEGKINAYNLLNQLNTKLLQFSVEKVNVPGQPFRALIQYKNFNILYLRIIKADDKIKGLLINQYDENYWPAIVEASPLKSWQQTMPATNDMQQHNTEIKIDALPNGEYLLVASTDKDFNGKKNIIGARLFYVSAISYVNNNSDYFVLNRDNGQPLSTANVEVWEQKYDYNNSKYIKEKGSSYKTDANGFFKWEKKPEKASKQFTNYSYLLNITHNNDQLFMNDFVYDYYYSRDNSSTDTKTITSVFLFSDRAIYRPGQTVFFKGIALNRNAGNKKSDVKNIYPTTVFLRDANYKDIDSINVET
ncbi:MAG: alpha-2-macroglobulin, partial [Chitinophagaceae bacterium]